MSSSEDSSPLFAALLDHRVSACVVDRDHRRINGGMAVETDYIIEVKPTARRRRSGPDFEVFRISKTYSAIRSFAKQLYQAATTSLSTGEDNLPSEVKTLSRYCENVVHLVESQSLQYLGKVNFAYVKILSRQRSQIINCVLQTTFSAFPYEIDSHPFLDDVAKTIEAFFLTDHCEQDFGSKTIKNAMSSALNKYNCFVPPKREDHFLKSSVVPLTFRARQTFEDRESSKRDLQIVGEDANLLLDDDRLQTELVPSFSSPIPTVQAIGNSELGTFMDNNPFFFLLIFGTALWLLLLAGGTVMTIDLDIALLVVFSSFCLGLHCPRPLVGGIDRPPLMPPTISKSIVTTKTSSMRRDTSGSLLLRRSIKINATSSSSKAVEDSNGGFHVKVEDPEGGQDEDDIISSYKSSMTPFPEGAELGSELNCWSDPPPTRFMVRGKTYLKDKKKVASEPYLFQSRGVDLFLTDSCPENLGRLSKLLGGTLRDVPTFIVNFRLPWGILLAYFEIPARFVPFLEAGYDDSIDRSTLPAMKELSPGDRCCARFLLGDDEHRTATLKLIPLVEEGPWVVKSIIRGKPAIIGNKLPIKYIYQPAEEESGGRKKAPYLEIDLDIAASSAARGILSVTRSYTQVLTLDLGFVIQGNNEDELPEQMLVATRLHGIDPLNSPDLPGQDLLMEELTDEDDE